MSERCGSRFDDKGSILLCERQRGHEGFHEYGDWEWMMEVPESGDIDELAVVKHRDVLLTIDQAIVRAELNDIELGFLLEELPWRGTKWITGQLNKLIAAHIKEPHTNS